MSRRLSFIIAVSINLLVAALIGEVRAVDIEPPPRETLLPSIDGVVWSGADMTMTVYRLAAYCAPVLWFSPDEPLFWKTTEPYITIPQGLPFEEPIDSAVVYYRITEILERPEGEAPTFSRAPEKPDYLLNLNRIQEIHLQYYLYFEDEMGVGAHRHDWETIEFSIDVEHQGDLNLIRVTQVVARAHGVIWYFNTLEIEPDVVFPMTILVEEGKHGVCTDRNGDGFYSPGYDVNKRLNDAWGVRDVLRTGAMFTSKYQSWMTKVRPWQARIIPPLPKDSPLYYYLHNHYRFKEHTFTQYTLRPVPEFAGIDYDGVEHGEKLKHIIEDKGYPEWPVEVENSDIREVTRALYDEGFERSWGIGYRFDDFHKVVITFPLFLVKNFEVPIARGWLVQAMNVNGATFSGDFRRFGHRLLYTPSASRWNDWYLAAGYEIQRHVLPDTTFNRTEFVLETGWKFRGSISETPLKFLRHLGTDFWGMRIGIRSFGFNEFRATRFIFEIGGGVW